MTFDFTLTKADVARILEFQARLDADGKEFFNSDLFREYHLDKHYTDPKHEVGALFAKITYHALAEAVGETPSERPENNRRKIDLYRWTTKGRKVKWLILA